jgi:hypothetical protein
LRFMNRLLNDVLDTSTVTICQPLAKFSASQPASDLQGVDGFASNRCF